MLSLLSFLACAHAPAAPAAAPAPGASFSGASLAEWYPDAGALLQGCELSGQTGMSVVLQLSCPGDRVLTDMRGPGAPGPATAVEAIGGMLRDLGLDRSSARPAPVALPGEGRPNATVLDAQGESLQVTVWVVGHLAAMPQTVSCMAMASDAAAAEWCPAAMAALLLPPAPQIRLPPRSSTEAPPSPAGE